MKKSNILFLLFFVIHSYSQDSVQDVTIVPENTETLDEDSID